MSDVIKGFGSLYSSVNISWYFPTLCGETWIGDRDLWVASTL